MKHISKIMIILAILLLNVVAIVIGCSNGADQEVCRVEYFAEQGGYIEGEAVQRVNRGSDGSSVRAVANDGYNFVEWSDGKKEAARFEEMVMSDIIMTAKFEKREEKQLFYLQYSCGDGGSLDGEAYQEIVYGGNGKVITAQALTGYRFVKWSDGNTNATRVEYDVTTDINVKAEFEFLYGGGQGTDSDPFSIKTYEHLINMRYYPAYKYVLENDLDLEGVTHEPIFNNHNEFFGVFDGGDHTIQNLTIESTYMYPSLFGVISKGSIVRNINISDFKLTVTDLNSNINNGYAIGSLVGAAYGNLENISVSGKIIGSVLNYPDASIGAIAGFSSGYINNCYADVSIELNDVIDPEAALSAGVTSISIGGLIGRSTGSIIVNSKVEGSILIAESNQYICVGGMVGEYLNKYEATIDNCEANVDINVNGMNDNMQSAGFICLLDAANTSTININNCISKGKVEAYNAAGFIYEISGYANVPILIKNCNAENNVTASMRASGFVWIATDTEISSCYSIGDITAVKGGYAVGFCYRISRSVIKYSYATGNITALTAIGFVFHSSDCQIEQCYTSGNVNGGLRSCGFAFHVSSGNITYCYSISEVNNTNEDPNIGRTLVAGFILGTQNSQIANCYYGGNVNGSVYAGSTISGPPIAGVFIGISTETDIINCHVLYKENTFATDIIVENRCGEDIITDICSYSFESQMYGLADILNKDDHEVFQDTDNNFPIFIWE